MSRDYPYTALIYDPAQKLWQGYKKPCETIVAHRLPDVLPALETIEKRVESRQLHAAGFVSYEAAAAFDPAFETHPAEDFPLLWFGLYEHCEQLALPQAESLAALNWQSTLEPEGFSAAVNTIKDAIARGETYQVNFTFPLSAPFELDAWSFFLGLVQNQQASHAAWFDTGRFAICSASPELFFELDGQRLTSRPMKGTAPRGMTLADDLANAEALQQSEKDRAENVMILDMIRNDLGRLPGGPVRTVDSFRIEKYPTLWQMTSTAETMTDASPAEVFRALFPCASITGAPKVQTMKLIRQLEPKPRKIYTGAIGNISPGRKARFSVAIRTALVDREQQMAEYGVGAGITWGSDPQSEYRECLLKGGILSSPRPDFKLLETLLWTPQEGFPLLKEHLERVTASATYFDYTLSQTALKKQLAALNARLSASPHKVRLLVSRSGKIELEASVIELSDHAEPLKVSLANDPIDSTNPFLYHKTTQRSVYEQALLSQPDSDEVLLWNERGELTEACNYNLVIEEDGQLLTPPVNSGLLGGTLRANLLAEGRIREETLLREKLNNCDALWLINSVRGWRKATLEKRNRHES